VANEGVNLAAMEQYWRGRGAAATRVQDRQEPTDFALSRAHRRRETAEKRSADPTMGAARTQELELQPPGRAPWWLLGDAAHEVVGWAALSICLRRSGQDATVTSTAPAVRAGGADTTCRHPRASREDTHADGRSRRFCGLSCERWRATAAGGSRLRTCLPARSWASHG